MRNGCVLPLELPSPTAVVGPGGVGPESRLGQPATLGRLRGKAGYGP
jgi:hypothetical protein